MSPEGAVREAAGRIGRTLTLQTVDAAVTSGEIVALPFFGEGKKIPRGLVSSILCNI
jgi:hypothetical protein